MNYMEKNIKLKHNYSLWEKDQLTDAEYALRFFIIYHSIKYPNKKLDLYLENEKYIEAFRELKFKKVKSKAIESLSHWIDGTWNFALLDYIPTPLEVLNYQARGIRPVTAIMQRNLKPILSREDCLEFLIHDLEHGYMFFNDVELKNMQIDFFSKIEKSLQTEIWTPYLKDLYFKEKFEYLISDMNSHKEHYKQYLHSIIPHNKRSDFDFLF